MESLSSERNIPVWLISLSKMKVEEILHFIEVFIG